MCKIYGVNSFGVPMAITTLGEPQTFSLEDLEEQYLKVSVPFPRGPETPVNR